MTSDIKTYSGYKGVIGILTSTHQTVHQVLRCMESCKGYPIWVHDNSNDWNHIQRIEKAVKIDVIIFLLVFLTCRRSRFDYLVFCRIDLNHKNTVQIYLIALDW